MYIHCTFVFQHAHFQFTSSGRTVRLLSVSLHWNCRTVCSQWSCAHYCQWSGFSTCVTRPERCVRYCRSLNTPVSLIQSLLIGQHGFQLVPDLLEWSITFILSAGSRPTFVMNHIHTFSWFHTYLSNQSQSFLSDRSHSLFQLVPVLLDCSITVILSDGSSPIWVIDHSR